MPLNAIEYNQYNQESEKLHEEGDTTGYDFYQVEIVVEGRATTTFSFNSC